MSGVTALRPNEAREIGGYTLLGRLGEGGMGTVYLAEAGDGSRVALKIIRDHLLDREEFRLRFRGEVERAKNVPPFCTAEVIEADPDHDPPYLVVEYVDGPSLAEIVRDSGPLIGTSLHSLGIGVATALTAIHGAGVIHRDLKPGNVLVPRGGVKVIDFGLARDSDGATGITRTDQVMGTVPYIAPERLGGTAIGVTAAADVFAWGAVMVYAATGHTPFGGDTPATTAVRILTEEPDLSGLKGPLLDIVARTLKKNPKDRPTARELLDLLMSAGARSVPQEVAQAAKAATVATIRPAAANTSLDIGTTADVPVPVVRRRGRGVLIGVLSVAAVAAVAVGIAFSGLFPLSSVGASGPSTTPAATTTPTASPSPSPPAGLSKDGLYQAFTDFMQRPGHWTVKHDKDNQADCVFDQRGMVATVKGPTYRCPGPKDVFGDLYVVANVTLYTEDSCTGIWLHYTDKQPAGGYAVQICRDQAYFVLHHVDSGHWAVKTLHSVPFARSLPLGTSTRFTVALRGGVLSFKQDGSEDVQSYPVPSGFASGRLCIGVLQRNQSPEGTEFSVGFDYVEVWGVPA